MPVQPFTTTNASKAVIIEGLALAFEQGAIAILNDPVLLGELQAFAAEQLPGGTLRYSAPGGGHDDCVISLALAWSAVEREPLNAIYRLTAENLYSDQTRPPGLLSQNRRSEHWITVELGGTQLTAAEFFDDGTTIFCERNFHQDSALSAKGDAELIEDIMHGSGDWSGFGANPRLWPGIIIPEEHAAFAAQLRSRGAWVIEESIEQKDIEDNIRRVAALLAQQKLKIHERCANIRREMRTRSWTEILTTEGKKRADPCRLFVSSRIQNWRLTA